MTDVGLNVYKQKSKNKIYQEKLIQGKLGLLEISSAISILAEVSTNTAGSLNC